MDLKIELLGKISMFSRSSFRPILFHWLKILAECLLRDRVKMQNKPTNKQYKHTGNHKKSKRFLFKWREYTHYCTAYEIFYLHWNEYYCLRHLVNNGFTLKIFMKSVRFKWHLLIEYGTQIRNLKLNVRFKLCKFIAYS